MSARGSVWFGLYLGLALLPLVGVLAAAPAAVPGSFAVLVDARRGAGVLAARGPRRLLALPASHREASEAEDRAIVACVTEAAGG